MRSRHSRSSVTCPSSTWLMVTVPAWLAAAIAVRARAPAVTGHLQAHPQDGQPDPVPTAMPCPSSTPAGLAVRGWPRWGITPYLYGDPRSTRGLVGGNGDPCPCCWPWVAGRGRGQGGAPAATRGRTTSTPARAAAGSSQPGQGPGGSAHRDHLRAGGGQRCDAGVCAGAPSLILVRGP